jgi:Uma2 family endonuclease
MTTRQKLTLAEFLALPETEPASELIDGEVVQKPMPTIGHGIVQRLLSFVFTLYLRAHPDAEAGSEIRCIFGPPDGLEPYVPDFVFFWNARERGIRAGQAFYGAPDVAVEILSPDDRVLRVTDKVTFYLTYGVRVVWIINPKARTITVMTTPSASVTLSEDEVLDGGDVLPGFNVAVRDVLPPADLPID